MPSKSLPIYRSGKCQPTPAQAINLKLINTDPPASAPSLSIMKTRAFTPPSSPSPTRKWTRSFPTSRSKCLSIRKAWRILCESVSIVGQLCPMATSALLGSANHSLMAIWLHDAQVRVRCSNWQGFQSPDASRSHMRAYCRLLCYIAFLTGDDSFISSRATSHLRCLQCTVSLFAEKGHANIRPSGRNIVYFRSRRRFAAA